MDYFNEDLPDEYPYYCPYCGLAYDEWEYSDHPYCIYHQYKLITGEQFLENLENKRINEEDDYIEDLLLFRKSR